MISWAASSSPPEHCEPANAFLYRFSALFSTCVPTNLAFVSTLLGTLSIVSWLFAQLPQIYKNYTIRSTAGLSIFFLGEWLLGDLSNLLGSILTRQALWQVIVAGYYCFVDCMLVGQWLWYEHLQYGNTPRNSRKREKDSKYSGGGVADMQEVIDGTAICNVAARLEERPASSKAADIPTKPSMFRMPTFSKSPTPATPTNRTIHRLSSSTSPMPSPKTLLCLALVLALTAQASPIASLSSPAATTTAPSSSRIPALGSALSWLSTLLYLGSRLPQLYKNHIRRSTDGLSFSLFAAAFFGNFFYSTSLLANPCAWSSFPPYGGRGWVGAGGSVREQWVSRAAPFWLGAAGVLGLDAAVGVQFWWFGKTEGKGERIGSGSGGRKGSARAKWRRVSGWMRGWVPSVSEPGTPRPGSQSSRLEEWEREEEGRALLGLRGGEIGYGGLE